MSIYKRFNIFFLGLAIASGIPLGLSSSQLPTPHVVPEYLGSIIGGSIFIFIVCFLFYGKQKDKIVFSLDISFFDFKNMYNTLIFLGLSIIIASFLCFLISYVYATSEYGVSMHLFKVGAVMFCGSFLFFKYKKLKVRQQNN